MVFYRFAVTASMLFVVIAITICAAGCRPEKDKRIPGYFEISSKRFTTISAMESELSNWGVKMVTPVEDLAFLIKGNPGGGYGPSTVDRIVAVKLAKLNIEQWVNDRGYKRSLDIVDYEADIEPFRIPWSISSSTPVYYFGNYNGEYMVVFYNSGVILLFLPS